MTAAETLPLDVDVLRGQLQAAVADVGRVESIVVQPVTGLVLVGVALPELSERDRARAQERVTFDLRVVEAGYSRQGYVFAPVFSP